MQLGCNAIATLAPNPVRCNALPVFRHMGAHCEILAFRTLTLKSIQSGRPARMDNAMSSSRDTKHAWLLGSSRWRRSGRVSDAVIGIQGNMMYITTGHTITNAHKHSQKGLSHRAAALCMLCIHTNKQAKCISPSPLAYCVHQELSHCGGSVLWPPRNASDMNHTDSVLVVP